MDSPGYTYKCNNNNHRKRGHEFKGGIVEHRRSEGGGRGANDVNTVLIYENKQTKSQA